MVTALAASFIWSIVYGTRPYNRHVLALVFALVSSTAACNRPAADSEAVAGAQGASLEGAAAGQAGGVDGTAEGQSAALEAAAEDEVVSPAPAAEGDAPPPVVAARPDALLPLVPMGDGVVLVDVAALQEWASRGIRGEDSAERVAGLLSELAVNRFEAIDPATQATLAVAPGARRMALAWDGEWARAVVDVASPGATAAESGMFVADQGAPSASPLQVPEAMPLDALVTMGVRDRASLPEGLRTALDFLDPFEVRALWIGVRGDGSATVFVETDQSDAVVSALGRGQVWVSQVLGQLRGEARPELQGWVTYLNRASQAVFGWVQVSTGPGHVLIEVPAPACGGPQRSLFALAFVATVADFAAEDPAVRAMPYVAMEGAIADGCAPVPGPAASLPISFAGLGARSDELGGLAVVDLGAALRAGLPTGFGVLPFALSGSTIDSVFGMRPMGMNGLDDGAAQVAWSGSVDPRSARTRQGVVIPSGMHVLAPEGVSLLRMLPYQNAAAVGWATSGFDLAADMASPPAPVWETGLQRAADGAFAALVINGATLRAWSTKVPATSSANRLLSEADGAVISLVSGGFSVTLFGVEPNASPELLRDEIAEAISLISRDVTNSQYANQRLIASQEAMSQFEVRTGSDSVTLTLQGAGLPVVAAAIRVAVPMLANTSRQGAILPPANQVIPLPIVVPNTAPPGLQRNTP